MVLFLVDALDEGVELLLKESLLALQGGDSCVDFGVVDGQGCFSSLEGGGCVGDFLGQAADS